MKNQDEAISRGEGWLTAWVGEELMMMNAESSYYLSLSRVGGRIWELLEKPSTVTNLCDALAAEYHVSPDTAYADVMAFIDQMRSQNAIQEKATTSN